VFCIAVAMGILLRLPEGVGVKSSHITVGMPT